ncbi:MAG: flagellar filament capping protein FliD [Lachnospiraceae bacterium]|nr:flagellar filament capping protein FliD [Lachnospiraceae bacterium]MBR1568766.1 flagellar filament capping protein FliD [Lachnospiraceae bacterium]
MNTNSFWTSSSINSFFNTSTYNAGRSDAFSGLYGSLGDSKLIQSGTYKRLMNKYYELNENNSAKNTKSTDTVTKKEPSSILQKLEKEREAAKAKSKAETDATGTTTATTAATESEEPKLTLTSAADALQADARTLASKDTFAKVKDKDGNVTDQYDTDKITDAVKSFVKDYNNLIDTAGSSKNSGVVSNMSRIKEKTGSNADSLREIGITVDSKGKLSVDENKLKNADMADVQKAFKDYGSAVATNSSLVGYYSSTLAGSSSSYNAQAAYNVQTGTNYSTGV